MSCTVQDYMKLQSEINNRFALIVPAHNEELLINKFCENILSINYHKELYDVFIIADNCSDRTESICSKYPLTVLTRHDLSKTGKGYALEWALEKIDLNAFDAILVLETHKLSLFSSSSVFPQFLQ